MEASAIHAPAFAARRAAAGPLLRLRSDDQLVALFRMGYDDAFRVIHDRYRARLLAYTRQMLGGARPDAEDVLQDVFLRAYGVLREDNRPVTLRAWLYRVAHNRCVDHLRRPLPAVGDIFEASRPPAHDPPIETERREDLRRLVCDVQRLPEQQRSALLMREMEGLSCTEMADALGVSVPAVKSLLVRARIGLVEAGDARDTACADIRADLSLAFDRGVRMSGRSRRHMRDCAACRGYRRALRGVHDGLGAMSPGHGGLAAIAKLLGLGGAGSGAATLGGAAVGGAAGSAVGGATALGGGALAAKLAIVSCAAVVGTGAAVEITHRTAPHAPAPVAAATAAARHTRSVPALPAPAGQRASATGGHRARHVRHAAKPTAAGVSPIPDRGPFPSQIVVTPHAAAPPMTLTGPPGATGGLLGPEQPVPAPAAPSAPPAAPAPPAASAGASAPAAATPPAPAAATPAAPTTTSSAVASPTTTASTTPSSTTTASTTPSSTTATTPTTSSATTPATTTPSTTTPAPKRPPTPGGTSSAPAPAPSAAGAPSPAHGAVVHASANPAPAPPPGAVARPAHGLAPTPATTAPPPPPPATPPAPTTP